jgi:PadR family transcriptional regulator, regulatory protein PadR
LFGNVHLTRGWKADARHLELLHVGAVYVEVQGMAPTKPDLPQGTLDLLILKTLTLEPLHGYAIAQRLQQVSRDVVVVQQGTLYPALHRLEKRGLLKAEWKPSDTGRDAKFYRLTRAGQARLSEERAQWRRLTEAVDLILEES